MDPGSAAHHAARHSASKTRVNALMALRSVRGTHPRQSKPRRTLFRERLDAFLDLGAAHAVAMPLVGGVFVELAAGDFVDGALHAAHRDRRIAGKNRGKVCDFLIQRLDRRHRGEVTDPQHLRGADLLRGQKQFSGVVGAEPRHIAPDAALVIMQPKPRRRHEHLAGVDADAEIAGQRQIGRAAIDAAIDPADRGNAAILEPVEADGGARAIDIEQRRARGRGDFGHASLHYLFSSSRRLASASMVSARSGCRAISMRKSTRSSTRSLDTRLVVILAERRLLPSRAISPKNAPSPSVTFLPGKSTSTSPAAMKYMQSPVWPLRMIMVRAGRSMVRSMCVTSAIAAGPSAAKNGTLLTDSQVFRKLSRRVSAAKPVARIPVQSPNTPSPQIITNAATTRPSGVIGTTSPYPTVVKVAIAHHKAAGTLPKVAGWTSRSRKYTDTAARNSTIRKITSTLNSGPDSCTSTLRNCRNPGIPGTTLSIQKMPSSHADLGFVPRMRASGIAAAAAASTRPRPDSA